MARKRWEPPVTITRMSDEEWQQAQERIAAKRSLSQARRSRRPSGFEKNKQVVDAGETFASQMPSGYRRRVRRK